LKTETREVPATTTGDLPPRAVKPSMDKPAAAVKPALTKSVGKPGLAAANSPKPAAQKKTVDKLLAEPAKPVTKMPRIAKTDPLAPLGGKSVRKTSKDSGSAQ
jgi:hypothetical protein